MKLDKRRGIKNSGVSKWTRARRIILDVFKKAKKHLSADEVFVILRKNYPGIGIATVYRTLDFLYQEGFLSRFQFRNNKSSYEISPEKLEIKKHHHHLVCSECGEIVDYTDFSKEESELVSKMQNLLSKKYGFEIKSHQLHFYGLCYRCRKNRERIPFNYRMVLKGGD